MSLLFFFSFHINYKQKARDTERERERKKYIYFFFCQTLIRFKSFNNYDEKEFRIASLHRVYSKYMYTVRFVILFNTLYLCIIQMTSNTISAKNHILKKQEEKNRKKKIKKNNRNGK